MEQQKGDILALQKDPVVRGTYEPSAFILSLRDPEEFRTIHSFGFHRIPHIGVYGSDYTVTIPMVLLSLPPVPSFLQKLPADLLNALDLQHIVAPQQRSPELVPTSQLQFLSERVQAAARNHGNSFDPDICIRIIARELVRLVISSACKRLGLNARNHLRPTTFMDLNWERATAAASSQSGESTLTFDKYRELKRVSTVSNMSIDGEPPRKESVASQQNGNGVTFNEHLSLDSRRRLRRPLTTTGRPIQPNTQLEDDEQLRLMAKKLIKKVLHAACKRWESLYRRSSIEYLTASTKRMRIATTPSPPPPLLEENSNTQTTVGSQKLHPEYVREDSPAPGKGTKRARSGSHEVYMLNELEEFRATQLHQKMLEATEHTYSRTRKILSGAKASSNTLQLQPPAFSENLRLGPDDSVKVLISNIGRMSIAEAEAESEALSDEGSDEECTILSAITKTPPVANADSCKDGSVSSAPLPSPATPTEPAIGSTTKGMQYGMEASSLTNDILLTSNSPAVTTGFSNPCSVVPGMDCYVVVHTRPPPGLCQKFLCSNRNEINILYHCWLFPDIPYDRSITRSEMLAMGVFEPAGVQSVHQELQDAGVPFHYLDQRTVCVHGCCFSPENAQLQLQSGCQLHTFFSAAKHENRRVCTYHIIPASDEVELTLRNSISKCTTVGNLLTELHCWFPEVGQKLFNLILPLCNI